MTDDDAVPRGGTSPARVRRLDERLGLAVDRAGLSARTLVTYARDHVSVRTPSRPDLRSGNTLDLVGVPAPGDLGGWVDRFGDTIALLGVRHLQVRWETPLDPSTAAEAPAPDPDLVAAAHELGLTVHPTTVLLLDTLHGPGRDRDPVDPGSGRHRLDVELARIAAPSAVPGGTPAEVERRWHAATVLLRYAEGETPDDWRAADADLVAWSTDVQRELAVAGRAAVWTAQRHGAPVARLTLLHDRQGLAVVEDVVVHPVHRRRGIAVALTHAAVAAHLADHPAARVGIAAEPASVADRLYRRLGFHPHATIWTALRV